MKHLSILGSTGSIGRNTLKIVELFPERFTVKALAAKTNTALLANQIQRFAPDIAVVIDETRAIEVVSAMVGAAGLIPTLDAIEAGKDIALANKETLVIAGEIVVEKAKRHGVQIFPVDSEHSAIFQCISGNRQQDLDKILLTGSGGPFLNLPENEFHNIKPHDALKHPTWQMGKKISIDSATLMNKGLEVIEARWLFDVSLNMIEVVIHPQSIVHSMVSFKDGSIIAQLGIPDMKGAIAYALTCPERLVLNQPLPDFVNIGALTFKQPDFNKFPCLALAYDACATGETLPAVLNAANEIAVEAFLTERVPFVAIPDVIKQTMDKHTVAARPTIPDILEADRWARETAEVILSGN